MLEQDKMNQIINSYLSSTNAEYALLLTGKWGCGKTYFVNQLIRENKDYLYYSLNGADDLNVLVKSLLTTVLISKFDNTKDSNFINKIAREGLGILSKVNKDDKNIILNISDSILNISIDSYARELFSQDGVKSPVLILDDLERISEKIDITDLLGAVHTKFVLNGVKVIYVADETQIKTNNIDAKSSYNNEKEKYIFRTISFRRDNEEVYKSLLNERELPESFLKILFLVFTDNQDNLRTVQFCLDSYKELEASYQRLNLPQNYNTPDILFYSICAIGKFYKAGNLDKEALLSSEATQFMDSYLKDKVGEGDNPYKKFVEQVRSVNFYYCYLERFIVEFIYDGFLDSDALKDFLQKPEEDVIDKFISGIDNLETSELEELLRKVKKGLVEEKYTIRQYGLIRLSFIPYASILNICTEEETMQLIEKSIFSDNDVNKKYLLNQYECWLKDPYSLIRKPVNKIEDRILKEFNEYKKEKTSDKTKEFYEKLLNIDSSIFVFDSENKDLYTRLMRGGYKDKILSMPNKSINMFTTYINSAVCSLINANEWYSTEIPALKELEDETSKKIDSIKNNDFLKEKALTEFKKILSLAVRHINGEDVNV